MEEDLTLKLISNFCHAVTAFLIQRKETLKELCLLCAIPITPQGIRIPSLPIRLLNQKGLKPIL